MSAERLQNSRGNAIPQCYCIAAVTLTSLVTFARLPPSNTTRVKETFAVRFVVVNPDELGLVTTKLNVVSFFGSKAGRFFVPPMTHLVDRPIILPWSSSRKHTAWADSTFLARLFFIFNSTTAFWPVICGGDTVTASCACANIGHRNIPAKQ